MTMISYKDATDHGNSTKSIEDVLFPVGTVTTLGRAVFVAMMMDDEAQARFLAIYGRPYFADDAS